MNKQKQELKNKNKELVRLIKKMDKYIYKSDACLASDNQCLKIRSCTNCKYRYSDKNNELRKEVSDGIKTKI